MTYRGYTGDIRVDPDANIIRGRAIDVEDVITFQGETVAEAAEAFRESMDDYLDFCQSLGESPERPVLDSTPGITGN